MEFKKDDYIIGSWFASNERLDWLMTVKRSYGTRDQWEGEYRFRYHKDEKIFNSDDKKSFYNFKVVNTTEKDLIEKLNTFAEEVSTRGGLSEVKFVEVKGDTQKFLYLIAQEDFCSIKNEEIPKAEEA